MDWHALGEEIRQTAVFIASDLRFWGIFLVCVACFLAWCWSRKPKKGN